LKIKTLQWNIGGGKIRAGEADPTSIASYTQEDLEYIIRTIKKADPDIITLQETHANKKINQAKIIADLLGYKYFINDVYDVSHVDSGFGLGQAIIARFEMADHNFEFFHDLDISFIAPSGKKEKLHKKGLSSVKMQIGEESLTVMTLHNIPFRKIGLDPKSAEMRKLREDIENKISKYSGECLLQGDFNVNAGSIKGFLPNILRNFEEVLTDEPTTPKGRKYDHVLYRGLRFLKKTVDSTVLTDHYPIICEFEI